MPLSLALGLGAGALAARGWCGLARWCSGARLMGVAGLADPRPPSAPHRALASRDRGRRRDAARHGHAERRHRPVVRGPAAGARATRSGSRLGAPCRSTPRPRSAGVRSLRDALRARSPTSHPPAPILGAKCTRARGDSLLTLFGYGVEPEAQGDLSARIGPRHPAGRDRWPPAQRAAPPRRSARIVGDTSPVRQARSADCRARAGPRGSSCAAWSAGSTTTAASASVGLALGALQRLAGRDAGRPRVAPHGEGRRTGVDAAATRARSGRSSRVLEVNSVGDLVAAFRIACCTSGSCPSSWAP